MRIGIVHFTSDRGIGPAAVARLIEQSGLAAYFVPEHSHIPMRRHAAHPGTGGAELPDERYLRTLDPWSTLGAAAAVTERIELGTAVALPVQSDPITFAKAVATVDHLSRGRLTLGVGFGWNTDELGDHGVPVGRRRTMLREYLGAMRALHADDEAAFDGEFVRFGPSWAWPKPSRQVPILVGAGGTEKNLRWIAAHADGWITTPQDRGIASATTRLGEIWAASGRAGSPRVVALDAVPDAARLSRWEHAGVDLVLYPAVDQTEAAASRYLARLADAVAQWIPLPTAG